MTTLDLTGLDRAAVLAALYNGAQPRGMGFLHFSPKPLGLDDAQEFLDERCAHDDPLYFDYLQGRCLKVDVGGETLDSHLYDLEYGAGAALRALETLRAGC